VRLILGELVIEPLTSQFFPAAHLPKGAADALGGTRAALWLATVVSAVLFSDGHYYQGPAGLIDSGIAGLILAAAYLAAGRNLWACILAHGLIDTVGVAALYFGWNG